MAATYTRGVAELRAFIRQLGRMPDDIRRELRQELKGIGNRALFDVRFRASWSARIPRATRLKIGTSRRNPGIAIEVDRHKAPHARPYEHGGEPGTFRAPLFGDRSRWFSHQARPFLAPGARPHFETVDRDVADAVDQAARRAGFR